MNNARVFDGPLHLSKRREAAGRKKRIDVMRIFGSQLHLLDLAFGRSHAFRLRVVTLSHR